MIPTRLQALGALPLAGRLRRLASRLKRRVRALRPAPPRASTTPETFDLFAPEVVRDPFPHYEELRRLGAVHFLPRHGCWLVLNYDEVSAALARPNLFSSRVPEWTSVDGVLLGADPPGHTAARRVLGQHFTPHALEAQGRFAEVAAARLLEPLRAGRRLDVLRDFAAPLAEEVAAHLIGFDAEAVAAMRDSHVAGEDAGQWLAALDRVIEGAAARTPLYAQLMGDGGGALAPEEARSLVRLVWVAGTTTTRRAISSAVLLLLQNPALRPRVESDANALAAFLEETVRLHPPEHMLSRVTTGEAELAGVGIPAGAAVKLCMAAANRDPARFERPASLVLERAPNRHLSFGAGIHRCLGASLARVEMAAAVRALWGAAPGWRAASPLDALGFVGFANDTERLEIEC